MVSRAVNYALRAILYMASREQGLYIGVKELSEVTSVPQTYLGKILQTLAKKGYLQSITGPGGGFRLAKPPSSITLIELIEVLDGKTIEESCFLGMSECNAENPCPIHDSWSKNRKKLLEQLSKASVAEMLKKSWPQITER